MLIQKLKKIRDKIEQYTLQKISSLHKAASLYESSAIVEKKILNNS